MSTSHGRLGPLSGILASVFLVVGFLLPGEPPKADDSVAQISSFLSENRDSILAGNFLIGLGGLFTIAFAASLASHLAASLREADHGLAGMIRAGAAVGVALVVAGAAVLNGIVFESAGTGAHVRAFWDAANGLFVMCGFGFAAMFGAAALANARAHAFPAWMTSFAGLAALLQVAGGAALFANSGFFATGGAFGFIVPILSTIWILCASAMMYRHHAPATTGQPAGGTPSPAV
jgi:hypothetical protein